MMTLAVAALSLLAPQAEKWELKPTLTKDAKLEYKMVIDVKLNSEEHTANFTFTKQMGEKGSDELYGSQVTWHDILVDDRPSDDLPVWSFKLSPSGAVKAAGGDTDDDYRRMISPFLFAYPEKSVGVGDKWEVKCGPKDGTTKAYEVKALERFDNDDVLKVEEKFKDADGMKSDGTWWINKAGKPLKFDMKISEWVLPFGGPEKLDASAKGTIVKG